MATRGSAQELILRLKVDATQGVASYRDLEKAVKAYNNEALRGANVLDGSLDEQLAQIREINQLWKVISDTVKGTAEAEINALTGVNERVQFANKSFGELLQTQRALEKQRANILPGTQEFEDVQSALLEVNTRIKEIEQQARGTSKAIGSGAPEIQKINDVLDDSAALLLKSDKSLSDLNASLKELKQLQQGVSIGSEEFVALQDSIDAVSGALKEVKDAQKSAMPQELLEGYRQLGDATSFTAAELKIIKKELESQAQVLDQSSAEFEQVASDLRSVNAALADYQRALKGSNTETATLTDTMKRFDSQIDSADASINDMNDTLKDLKRIQSQVGVGSKDFQEVTAAIAKMEARLKDAKGEIKDVEQEVGGFTDKLKGAFDDLAGGFGTSFDEIKGLFSGGGAPGKGGLFSPMVLGATVAVGALVAIGSKLVELGAEVIEASKEFTKFRQVVGSFTGATGADLDTLTAKTKTIADTFEVDVSETMSAASNFARQFGLSAEEALNLVNDGMINAAGKSDEVLAALEEFSGTFKQAGLSAQQAAQVITVALNEGVKPDKFVDAINEANIKLLDESEDTAEKINDAFGNTFGSDLIKKVQAGELTTVQALESVTTEAVKTGLGASDARAALIAVTGSMGEEAGTVESFAKAFERLASGTIELSEDQKAAKEAILENQAASQDYNEALNDLNRALGPITSGISKFFTQIKTGVAQVITLAIKTFDYWGASIKALLNPFGFLYDLFVKLKGVISQNIDITGGISKTFTYMADVVTRVVAVVSGAINDFTAFFKTTTIGKASIDAINSAIQFFEDTLNSLLSGVNSILDAITEWIKSNETISSTLNTIKDIATDVFTSIEEFISGIIQGVVDWISQNETLQATFAGIYTVAKRVADFIFSLYDSITGFFETTQKASTSAIAESTAKAEEERKKKEKESNIAKAKAAKEAAKEAAKQAEEAAKAQEEALKRALEGLADLRKKAFIAEAENQQDRLEVLKRTQAQEREALIAQAGFNLLKTEEQGALLKQLDNKFAKERIAILKEQLENSRNLQLAEVDAQADFLATQFGQTEEAIKRIRIDADAQKIELGKKFVAEEQLILDQETQQQLINEEDRVKRQRELNAKLSALALSETENRKELQEVTYKALTDTINKAEQFRQNALDRGLAESLTKVGLNERDRFQIEFAFTEERLKGDLDYLTKRAQAEQQALKQGLISEEEFQTSTQAFYAERAQKEQELFELTKEYSDRQRAFRKEELQLIIETGPFDARIAAIREMYDAEIEAAEGNANLIKKLEREKTAAVIEETQKQAQVYIDMYNEVAGAATALFDQLDANRQKELDSEIETSQERQQVNEEKIQELEKQEESTTGSKKRRIQQELAAAKQVAASEIATQKKLEEEKTAIEKAAFERNKAFSIVQAIINGATAIMGVLASTSGVDPTGILTTIRIIATAAVTAAQIATIAAAEFEKGGIIGASDYIRNIKKAKKGMALPQGLLRGPSHESGGIRFNSGGIPMEAEGGEIVLTKGVAANPTLRSIASAINVAGGGISFRNGGVIPFANGGVVAGLSGLQIDPAEQQVAAIVNGIGAQIANMPAPQVAVKEIESVQTRVRVLEQAAKI